jgi:hypothetical protein
VRQNNELHSGWLINGGGDDRNSTRRPTSVSVLRLDMGVDHNEPEKLELLSTTMSKEVAPEGIKTWSHSTNSPSWGLPSI